MAVEVEHGVGKCCWQPPLGFPTANIPPQIVTGKSSCDPARQTQSGRAACVLGGYAPGLSPTCPCGASLVRSRVAPGNSVGGRNNGSGISASGRAGVGSAMVVVSYQWDSRRWPRTVRIDCLGFVRWENEPVVNGCYTAHSQQTKPPELINHLRPNRWGLSCG